MIIKPFQTFSHLVTVVDYGASNIASLINCLTYIGVEATVSSNPEDITRSDYVILPGVGSFSQSIENIRKRGIDSALQTMHDKNKPILGICLGMQLLGTTSQEEGLSQGLNLVPGDVVRFPSDRLIPHVGWNQCEYKEENVSIFRDCTYQSDFYFVHSYHFVPRDSNNILAVTNYKSNFVSAIKQGNTFGVQFHPEKSHKAGLSLIKSFLSI